MNSKYGNQDEIKDEVIGAIAYGGHEILDLNEEPALESVQMDLWNRLNDASENTLEVARRTQGYVIIADGNNYLV